MAKYANPTDVVLDPGKNYTAKATNAAISAQRFVSFAAGGTRQVPKVATATATTPVVGVSKYDAAANETIGVLSGGHAGVVAGGAITAGQGVVSDASGKAVVAGAGVAPVGIAYTDAAANAVVYIQF